MSGGTPRISLQGLRVLGSFLNAHPDALAGSDLMDSAGISSGSLYPLLARFEQAGWLHSSWEQGDPALLGRPRRRFYRLTAVGRSQARASIQAVRIPGLKAVGT